MTERAFYAPYARVLIQEYQHLVYARRQYVFFILSKRMETARRLIGIAFTDAELLDIIYFINTDKKFDRRAFKKHSYKSHSGIREIYYVKPFSFMNQREMLVEAIMFADVGRKEFPETIVIRLND